MIAFQGITEYYVEEQHALMALLGQGIAQSARSYLVASLSSVAVLGKSPVHPLFFGFVAEVFLR